MHKDFKMSKSTKRMLSLLPFRDNESRHHFKRCMIEAQVSAEKSVRDNQKSKDKAQDGE